MTPEQEAKILSTLYDRIYDAITYVPGGGKSGGFAKDTTYLQMTKNIVLNPADYQNASSPMNPKGDLRSTLALSDMVDVVPTLTTEWADSTNKVSSAYKGIVDGANTDNTMDPAQKATYDKAYAYLNSTSSIDNFDGPPTVSAGPSPISLTYDENQTSYVNAVGGYRTAWNSYDLDDLDDQRKFNAVAPGLQNNLDQAWNKWNREGKANVERATDALASTINDAVAHAISLAQAEMVVEKGLAPLQSGGVRWYPSYAMPTNWADLDCEGSKLELSSSHLDTNTSDYANEYSSHSKGIFWTSSSSEEGNTQQSSSRMESNDFSLSAELITVRIRRPWLNTLLFKMGDWWMKGVVEDGISNGQIAGNENGVLPLIPTAFIVARNVKISANFSEQDQSHFATERTTRSSSGWGWGPFSGGGSYSHTRQENSTFNSDYSGGTLTLPGLQLIAWVSSIVTPCPPKSGSG